MEKKLVSVIITTFNAEKYIERALLSVLNQTYDEIEIIVSDDCSSDQTISFAESILKNSGKRYSIVKNTKNSGSGETRNKGIEVANGEWIFFLDCDDAIDPNAISEMIIYEDADVVFGSFDLVDGNDKIIETKYDEKPILFKRIVLQRKFLKRKIKLLCPGTLYKKEFLKTNDIFFKKIRWSEDQEFLWNVLLHASNIYYLKSNIYHYFVNNSSVMDSSKKEFMIESFSFFESLQQMEWDCKLVKKYLAQRWFLGTINSYAHMARDYEDWKSLYCKLNGKQNCKKMLLFPELRAQILSLVCLLFPRLQFKIFSRRNKR